MISLLRGLIVIVPLSEFVMANVGRAYRCVDDISADGVGGMCCGLRII